MTNEEAIYILRNTAFLAPSLEPIDEAIDMACEALKTADAPQTDLPTEEFVEGMKNLKMEVKRTDCDRYVIVNDEGERAYNCIGCQTDCPWR